MASGVVQTAQQAHKMYDLITDHTVAPQYNTSSYSLFGVDHHQQGAPDHYPPQSYSLQTTAHLKVRGEGQLGWEKGQFRDVSISDGQRTVDYLFPQYNAQYNVDSTKVRESISTSHHYHVAW